MKKIGLICLVLVLAMGMLGAAYATWSQTLTITEEVNTGDFCIGFGTQPPSIVDNDAPPPVFPTDYPDQMADLGIVNVRFTNPGKNVAWGEIAYDLGANPIGMSVTLHDVYPWYYNHFNFRVHNCGTIPAHLNKILVKDAPGPAGNILVEITSDGQLVTLDLDVNGTPDFQFDWGDNIGDQFDPCIDKDFSCGILVLQDDDPTWQNNTFTFYIELVFDQFNYVP